MGKFIEANRQIHKRKTSIILFFFFSFPFLNVGRRWSFLKGRYFACKHTGMERKVCSDVGGVGNQHVNLKNKVLLGGDDGRENLCEADDMRLSENKLNTSRRGKREKAAIRKKNSE